MRIFFITEIILKHFSKIFFIARFAGVILTQPDYRLSFHLKLYESIEKGDGDITKQYLDTYRWMNANVRKQKMINS